MKIVKVDGRGTYKKEQKAGVREKITEWLNNNGGQAKVKECSEDTGFHRSTVGRHFEEIIKEQEGK